MAYYRGQPFRMTPLLWIIVFNFVVHLLLLVSPDLTIYIGMVPAYINKMPWTIFTAMFAHGSFGHLFANMITLFFFGRFLQQVLGEKKFLLVYFGGGLTGNILYLLLALFTPIGQAMSLVVGASGAVFALGGVLTVLAPKMRVYLYFFIPLPLWTVVIFGFLLLSFMPGVAWEAHLGGLLFGLAYGLYFKREQAKWRW